MKYLKWLLYIALITGATYAMYEFANLFSPLARQAQIEECGSEE